MNPRMRDYLMRRDRRMTPDERNPYGSRGGYVSSSRPDRRYDRDYGYEGCYEGEFRGMSRRDERFDDERRPRDYGDYRGGREDYGYPQYHDYGYRDYNYPDYGGGYLSNEEIKHWKHKLYEEIDKGEREMLSDEKILKRAKEMGVHYDNFSEEELIVTTLMMFTDYCKTLGKANIDMYIKLAKDFLDDKDANVKYSEKLTAYYDHIVNV